MTPSPDPTLRLRLRSQLIEPSPTEAAADPAHVVEHLCALQSQDYAGALWSVGLRCAPGTGLTDVERAIAERRIVRTWPMRGTLHFVASEDVRWMLALLASRPMERAATRQRQLGLDAATLELARSIATEGLAGGQVRTRPDMMAMFQDGGLDTDGQRGYHALWWLAQQALICMGPNKGRQQTFVLLDDWIPPATDDHPLDRPEALGRLAARYLDAHGPATVADLAWWAGITKTDARAGISAAGDAVRRIERPDGAEYWQPADAADPADAAPQPPAPAVVHLLPGFDEYFLGYTDRSLQLGEHREAYSSLVSSNGFFWATMVIGGQVAGTWRRTLNRDTVEIQVRLFRMLTAAERTGLARAADRYGEFLGLRAKVTE